MNNNNYWILGMVGIIALLVLAMVASGCTTPQVATPTPLPTTKTIVDAAGRSVTVPYNISRVVVSGTPPLLNAEMLIMGQGSTIVNGLPASLRLPKYRFLYVFNPKLIDEPDLSFSPGVEQVLSMDPDVVITDTTATVNLLANKSIPVVYLGLSLNTDQTKAAMDVLGQVFDKPDRAKEWSDYNDAMLAKIQSRVASVPVSERPKVMYFLASTMNVANGSEWINAAGGVDVYDPVIITSQSKDTITYAVTTEQLMKWNPDVIIIHNIYTDYSAINNSTALSSVNAVKNNRIYATPLGACWWYRGPEKPLLTEWLASKLYPDKFPESEVVNDTKAFYKEFFNYNLTDQEARDMLGGMVNATTMTP